MDRHIMRCGTIGSCQSAATSEIVKRCWSRVHSCKRRYNKCPDLYLYLYLYLYMYKTTQCRWRHVRRVSYTSVPTLFLHTQSERSSFYVGRYEPDFTKLGFCRVVRNAEWSSTTRQRQVLPTPAVKPGTHCMATKSTISATVAISSVYRA